MSDSIATPNRSSSAFAAPWQSSLIRFYRWLQQRLWLLLPLLAIPAIWPLLKLGLPLSADGTLHLLRVVLLDHHISNGVLYPRWVPELFTGLGYPVFNFYSPLAYYLAELLHLIGLDFVAALIASFAVLIVFSGFGMYRLARDVLGSRHTWAALVAATAYMYAPYLLTNVYIRGAIAEVGAQAWLPWVFWSARRMLTAARPSQYVVALALTLAGLALTHNITLLFTPLILAAYIMVVWVQTDRSPVRLGWIAVGLVAAMGVSAFFWAPLIGERGNLAETAYEAAKTYLPENVWRLHNFLDTSFAFEYTKDVPFRLGLVQVILAAAGLLSIRRRDAEWLYFIAMALLAGLAISVWAQPLWLSSDILLVAQFPWRLLSFLSIPLALFTGAILVRVPRESYRVAGAVALVALIIVANRPQVDWMPIVARPGTPVTLPAVSQFEYETGAFGTGSVREFLPRWNTSTIYEPQSGDAPVGELQITVRQADDFNLKASVSSETGGPLHFTSLYYPAWRVTLEDGTALATYPDTNLGLLTVDVPPGSHELYVEWAGTNWQRWATALSLLTLALLVIITWYGSRPRWLALLPLALLALGVVIVFAPPRLTEITSPSPPVATSSLELLGYRGQQDNENALTIYPYWYTRQTPSADLLVSWQLRDEAGAIVTEATARPYFSSQLASNWPATTLVDDAYRLGLPPDLAAGTYELFVQVAEGGQATDWASLGPMKLAASDVATIEPANQVTALFGEQVALAGYDLRETAATGSTPVVRPGDSLDYTVYWRARQPLLTSYHGFIHLVDQEGVPLVKEDHLAGSFLNDPLMWDTFSLQPDRYSLRIPEDAAGGLYWPVVGLYDFATVDLLPVQDASGQTLGDTYRLPPIKVINTQPHASPQNEVAAKMGDLATLLRYDLELPKDGLRAGSAFTITLSYQVDSTTERDLTQFVQLFNPDLGMAAQQDSPPQNGANPTWAWTPGETVVDVRTLRLRDDAQPGQYQLLVGLYDPADGSRLEVRDSQGTTLPDGQVKLTVLPVGP